MRKFQQLIQLIPYHLKIPKHKIQQYHPIHNLQPLHLHLLQLIFKGNTVIIIRLPKFHNLPHLMLHLLVHLQLLLSHQSN